MSASANLASNLSSTGERSPDDVALVFEGNATTFAQLEDGARRAASGFAALGVQRGDRVALWMGNHPSFAAGMYGAWRLGAVIVPMHAMLTEPEGRHIIKDAGAKIVLCGDEQFAKLTDADGRQTHDTLREAGSDESPPITDVGADDLAMLGYTSGTSGLPKGAMLTHGNLRSNLDQMKQTPIATRAGDVSLCVLPLFHIYGLNVVLNLCVDVGAKLVLHERFDPAASLAAIRENAVTRVAAAPPAYVAWLGLADAPADSFAGVEVAVSGAAPLGKEILEGFEKRFGVTIWEGYGLTETSPALTSTAMGGVAKPGSIGRPIPGVELKLVDEDGDEVDEPGDPGEVCVRGPNVFGGYWNRPEETEAAFADGWFKTGDVAVIDDDGDLYLVDRRRDLIIVSGFNVYPREVEDVIRRHPNVGDCAVVGAADAHSGESVRAIVVPDPPGEGVTGAEVIEFCRRSLAPYKIPSRVDVVSEIPRNAAGKVLRRVLRD
jgi:long-chain acyl-CoA synthetase